MDIRIIILVIFFTLSGCAFAPQAVVLQPEVSIQPSNIGSNKSIKINVVDERTRSTLGTRGGQGIGAELTIEGDLVDVVSDALRKGLSAQGFQVTEDKTAEDMTELRVELRALDYRVTTGFWSGTLTTESAMKGICIMNLSRPYERLYRGEHEESVLIVQDDSSNNEYVNIALSATVNNLLSDTELTKCLAN